MGAYTSNQFILFAHGADFDVDAYLPHATLTFEKIWRRGEEKHPGAGQFHTTSGVQMVLGDGRVIPLPEQERMACEFLKANRDSLRDLASRPGARYRILGLQYHIELSPGIGGLSMGPSPGLMGVLLDVGFRPTYYVTIDHVERSALSQDRRAGRPPAR
jgi:hypothetical protein